MRVAAWGVVVVLAVAGFADASVTWAGRVATPVFRIEKGNACVAPTDEMRRNHMTMLLHRLEGHAPHHEM